MTYYVSKHDSLFIYSMDRVRHVTVEQANEGWPFYNGRRRVSSHESDDVTSNVIRRYRQVDVAVSSSSSSGEWCGVVLRGGRQTDLLLRVFAGRARVGADMLPVQLQRSTAATSAAPGPDDLLRALRDDDNASF